MNEFIKRILLLSFLVLLSGLVVGCNKNKKEDMKKIYKWGAGSSSPLGYPIRVTVGGFSFGALNGISSTKEWGNVTYRMGSGEAPLPRQLYVEWVSIAEGEHGKAYQIKADIDYEKMEKLFDEGYELEQFNGEASKPRKFNTVVAGFTPGGVVIVWIRGDGRRIEIGRYQGYEVTPEDSNLYPETLKLLTPYWNDMDRTNISYIPKEVLEANKGKEPPYGLWDSLRQRFDYTVKLECADGGRFIGGDMDYVNGELKYTYPKAEGEVLVLKEEAAPRRINIIWRSKNGKPLGAEMFLEESYSLALFKRMQEGDTATKIELTIRISEANDYCTLLIKNNKGKEEIVKLDPRKKIEFFGN